MGKEHYKAGPLLGRLVAIGEVSIAAARRSFSDLLAARHGDLIELGVTLESRARLRLASDGEIATWQKRIQQQLRDDVRSREKNRFVSQRIDLESVFLSSDRGLQFDVEGATGDLLMLQTYALARTVGRDRLRFCECGRLFVRNGRREYCSVRCQSRNYMRWKRAEEKGTAHDKATRARRR